MIKLSGLVPQSNKESLNEDLGISVVLLVTAMLQVSTALSRAGSLSGGGSENGWEDKRSVKEKLQDFWNKYTKVKPLMDRLDKDPEVQDYIKKNMSLSSSHKGFRNLLKSKMSAEDSKLLSRIKFDDMPSVKSDRDTKKKEAHKDKKDTEKLINKAKSNFANRTVVNPKTGNKIKLSTALGYDKTSPVYITAKNIVKGGN